jgi:hypothetical protein
MCALSSVMEDSIWCNVNDKNSGPTGTGLVVVGIGACRLPRSDADREMSDEAYGQGLTEMGEREDKQAYRRWPRRKKAICL